VLVDNAEAGEIGRLAFDAGIPLTGLSQKRTGLEESFLTLVGEEGSL
jgi:ABC-2 type transport system ATP-binding protein